ESRVSGAVAEQRVLQPCGHARSARDPAPPSGIQGVEALAQPQQQGSAGSGAGSEEM
ncbi:hypothetical protein GGI11_005904, partial [Coemansia sp. RSA 2049]